MFYPDKPIIVSELQAEPWGPKLLYELPLDEQKKTMTIEQFNDNINMPKPLAFRKFICGVRSGGIG